MLPALAENHKTADNTHKEVLSGMAKSDNPVPFASSLLVAGNNLDESWAELERVKAVISYIQSTPAEQLTELSVGGVYAKS